jgi:hypothetical protein
MFNVKKIYIYRAAQTFQKSSSNLKIPGARKVTSGKIHTEDPQKLSATAQNLIL